MATETENSDEELKKADSNLKSVNSEIYKSVCHTCPPNTGHKGKDTKKLIIVSIVCVIFMAAEITGGIFSNSLAIITDAAHLLTDFGAFMVSLAAIWISSKPQTKKMSYGFHRAEIIGALISVLTIWLITGILVYIAVGRVQYPTYELDAVVMIFVSVFGILANMIMAIILVTDKKNFTLSNNSEDSINVKSAVLHVIGDLLQSFGVFLASLIIYFYPHLKVIDPICTFLFSAIVLVTTLRMMADIFNVLMEGFPRHYEFSEVKNMFYSVPGVKKIHNMRMWSLTMDKVALSAHIAVRKGENYQNVLKNATEIISRNCDVYELTLQIENVGDPVNECSTCT